MPNPRQPKSYGKRALAEQTSLRFKYKYCCGWATAPNPVLPKQPFYLNMSALMRIRLNWSLGLTPMRFWQRFVAAILLIAFVPASIAAALPLVYCFGADGHRGIELVQSTPHHVDSDVQPSDHSEHGAAVEAAEGCIDYKVTSLAGFAPRGIDLKSVLSKSPPIAPAIFADRSSWRAPPQASPRTCHSAASVAEPLALRRTVVLLI